MWHAYLITQFTGLLPVLTVAFAVLLAALAVTLYATVRIGAWRRVRR